MEQEPNWNAARGLVLFCSFSATAPDAIITMGMMDSRCRETMQRSEGSKKSTVDSAKERPARRATLRPALLEERLDLLEIFGEAALDGILDESKAAAPKVPRRKPRDAA